MTDAARSVSEAVEQLNCRGRPWIGLSNNQCTDAQLAELADCLLAHPNAVKYVYLGSNKLTDETGVRLARYVAASSTVECWT